MQILKLYNTLSRKIEDIVPVNADNKLRIYCCGPTVYNYAHIGNFRTFLAHDLLHRMLKVCGYDVIFVRNITDVDDKTIKNSIISNVSLKEFTEKWTKIFHEDMVSLNILPPTVEPRATDHIAEQIELIQELIDNNCAYIAKDGSVYFRLKSFQEYGKLSRIKLENLHTQECNSAGNKNLSDEYDRDSVQDFALWKSRKSEDGDVFWQSPWGEGRPGWHIECSAMAMKYLGEEIDIHCGGIDLCFPHHENEIAQTECITHKTFAKHWFHSAHLQVEGQKMSKSLGNLLTLSDLKLKNYDPCVVRYCLLSGHYRQSLNFTYSGLQSAASSLEKIRNKLCLLKCKVSRNLEFIDDWTIFNNAFQALLLDLNVPKCIGEIFKVLNNFSNDSLLDDSVKKIFERELSVLMYILGVENFFTNIDVLSVRNENIIIPEEITQLAEERLLLKKEKNFARADKLRMQIVDKGWSIKDTKDGYELIKNI